MGNLIIKGKGGAGNKLILQDQAGAAVLTTADSGATLAANCTFPTGHILQTLTVHKTDSEALTGSTWTAVPGMSLAITPSSTSSKILISVAMQVAGDGSVGRYLVAGRLYRGSTAIGLATDPPYNSPPTTALFVTGSQEWSNYNTHHMVNFYLDSPNTTSATTYSIKVWDTRNNGVVYINRHHYQNQSSDSPRGTSSILIQEIAG